MRSTLLVALICLVASSVSTLEARAETATARIGTVAPSGTPWSALLSRTKKRLVKAAAEQLGADALKIKLYLGGKFLYAPDVTTGGDFDSYMEIGARASYKLLENAEIFLGLESIEADRNDFEYEAFEGLLFGFKFDL